MLIIISLVGIGFLAYMIWFWERGKPFPKELKCISCNTKFPLTDDNLLVGYGQPGSVGDDGAVYWGKCPHCGHDNLI